MEDWAVRNVREDMRRDLVLTQIILVGLIVIVGLGILFSIACQYQLWEVGHPIEKEQFLTTIAIALFLILFPLSTFVFLISRMLKQKEKEKEKTMKKTMSLIVLLVAAASYSEEGQLKVTGSWETAVSSMFLGMEGLVLYDKPILENSLTLSGESGWYAGVWTAFPLQKEAVETPDSPISFELSQTEVDSEGNEQTTTLCLNFADAEAATEAPFDGEIDLFIGLEKELGCLQLNGRLMYWLIGDLGNPADDLWSANLKVSVPDCLLIQPFIEIEHLGEVGDLSPKSGNYVFAGLTRRQGMGFRIGKAEEEQALDLELRCAWSDGAFGLKPAYVYTRLMASSDIQLSQSCHLVPQLLYQIAGSDQTGEADDYVDGDKLAVRLAFRLDL